jgi:hypothetical protein
MSVTVTASDLTQIRDLFTLYSKKNAFVLEEYAEVGAISKRISDAVESKSTELSVSDVKYVLSAITVCAQRAPMELQNYKPIVTIYESLVALVKDVVEDEEETKE